MFFSLLIEKKTNKMEQKKQEFYLHDGSWNEYNGGNIKIDIEFKRKDNTNIVSEVNFLEYDDNSKKFWNSYQ